VATMTRQVNLAGRPLEFLHELANLRDQGSRRRLARRFSRLMPDDPSRLDRFGTELRRAWRVPDLAGRKRALSVLEARTYKGHVAKRDNKDFWLLMLACYAHDHAPQLRYCRMPGCPTPFFVSGYETNYCEDCRPLARNLSKLDWWNKHKEPILEERRRARKRKKTETQKRKERQ
jgi:hypothetical protein